MAAPSRMRVPSMASGTANTEPVAAAVSASARVPIATPSSSSVSVSPVPAPASTASVIVPEMMSTTSPAAKPAMEPAMSGKYSAASSRVPMAPAKLAVTVAPTAPAAYSVAPAAMAMVPVPDAGPSISPKMLSDPPLGSVSVAPASRLISLRMIPLAVSVCPAAIGNIPASPTATALCARRGGVELPGAIPCVPLRGLAAVLADRPHPSLPRRT